MNASSVTFLRTSIFIIMAALLLVPGLPGSVPAVEAAQTYEQLQIVEPEDGSAFWSGAGEVAYSFIAHFGYLLVAFLATGALGIEAVSFYLVAYFVMTLGAFGVVTFCSSSNREAESQADYHGLAWRRPWLAGLFTAMLLSLAGVPLTGGFIAKFYVFAAGVGSACGY